MIEFTGQEGMVSTSYGKEPRTGKVLLDDVLANLVGKSIASYRHYMPVRRVFIDLRR